MLGLLLGTLDFAATLFVLFSPWAKYAPVDADNNIIAGVPRILYLYDLQHEFLVVKENASWVAFYVFLLVGFVCSVLGFTCTLVEAFGSELDMPRSTTSGAILYGLQAVALVIAGGVFHDASGKWLDYMKAQPQGSDRVEYWHVFVAPAVLWIVVAHALALSGWHMYSAMRKN
jgi:hypothetical protein